MTDRFGNRCVLLAGTSSGIGLSALCSGEASAHIKWFCAFNVAGQPRGLENVLCSDFEQLVGLAILVLFLGCILDGTPFGNALLRALDRVTSGIASNSDLLLRAVCAFFFVALFTAGNILLTPELKTDAPSISWLQLAIAAGLIWRRTLVFSALGIVVLFALAVAEYGAFHLMDYPIFLGIAAYLALTGMQRKLLSIGPLDVVRWSAAITLMWASVEKWAYPEWSFPLFITHPAILLGFDDEFFMRAAGVVEFTLAFALLLSPLVRRTAAIILAAMFVSAVFEFGKLDLIGHAPIVFVLLTIVGHTDGAAIGKRQLWLGPIGYAVALVGFLALYYGAHAYIFGTVVL